MHESLNFRLDCAANPHVSSVWNEIRLRISGLQIQSEDSFVCSNVVPWITGVKFRWVSEMLPPLKKMNVFICTGTNTFS
jgi:hypothetical protein